MIDFTKFNPGILEVYYGPMKAGKGEELIYRVKPLLYSSIKPFVAFKPLCDDRNPGIIYSRAHDDLSIPAISIPENNPWKALEYVKNHMKIVIFDETQFFDKGIVGLVEQLLQENKNVVIAGLDLDFRGEPFGAMSELIAMASLKGFAKQLYANCDYVETRPIGDMTLGGMTVYCNAKATRTQRLVNGQPAGYNDITIVTGDSEGVVDRNVSYEARCLKHHFIKKL